MRLLACVAVLTLAAACDAPKGAEPEPSATIPSNRPGPFSTDAPEERAYAGEWALMADQCGDTKKVWTIEANRMGMKRERFCVFDRIYVSNNSADGEAWSASARCLAGGRESHDFVFFRVKPNKAEMRVTINDANAIDLVRCPMRT